MRWRAAILIASFGLIVVSAFPPVEWVEVFDDGSREGGRYDVERKAGEPLGERIPAEGRAFIFGPSWKSVTTHGENFVWQQRRVQFDRLCLELLLAVSAAGFLAAIRQR